MKSICITSGIDHNLKLVASLLQQAGMMPPKSTENDPYRNINFWHQQVISATDDASNKFQVINNPGGMWEKLASEIFLANIDSKIWGWAEKQSTWLLDFWANFEPRLNFVLVCCSPAQMLADAISNNQDILSTDTVITEWQEYHQQMLRFYHRNSQRCIFVDAQDCLRNPKEFLTRCSQHWKLTLNNDINFSEYNPNNNALPLFIAKQMCFEYTHTNTLLSEIKATVSPLVDDGNDVSLTPLLNPEQIVADFRELKERSAELERYKELVTEHQKQIEQLSKAHSEQTLLANDRQSKLNTLTNELKTVVDELAASRKDNELQLVKLLQVEEELKKVFLDNKLQQNKIQQLAEDRNQQSQLAGERQLQIDELTNEQKIIVNELATERKENEILLLQLHQLQEELEKVFLDNQSQQNEINKLIEDKNQQSRLASERHQQIEKQTKTIDEQAKHEIERKKQLESLTAAKSSLEKENAAISSQCDQLKKDMAILKADKSNGAKLKEIEQENGLLLLQLHQVQEELEHYFLQHQDVQKQLQKLDGRWQRILRRYPDYCDYEAIEITSIDETNPGHAIWIIRDLDAAGRNFPELQLKTILNQGIAGLILYRQPGTNGPLLHWPITAIDQTEVTLTLIGKTADNQQELMTLLDLGQSDWNLIQILIRQLNNELESPSALNIPDNLPVELLQNGLTKLGQILAKFPVTYRYDTVKLKHEQVNPDYEHLWFCIENIALGKQLWPAFEFRLSCGNVRPGAFGKNPKLEFPESASEKPLQAWFLESQDDFGGKLELRFALPDAMDLGIWQQLSDSDHLFISNLMRLLPGILKRCKAEGLQIYRSWEDWIDMVVNMQRIISIQTAPTAAASPSLPASRKDMHTIANNEKKSRQNAP